MARAAVKAMLLEPRVREFCELEGIPLTEDQILFLNSKKVLGVIQRGDFEQARLILGGEGPHFQTGDPKVI